MLLIRFNSDDQYAIRQFFVNCEKKLPQTFKLLEYSSDKIGIIYGIHLTVFYYKIIMYF